MVMIYMHTPVSVPSESSLNNYKHQGFDAETQGDVDRGAEEGGAGGQLGVRVVRHRDRPGWADPYR
jgi:hypothetical protein